MARIIGAHSLRIHPAQSRSFVHRRAALGTKTPFCHGDYDIVSHMLFPRLPLLSVLNEGYRVPFSPCPLRFGRYDRSPFHPEFVDRWTNLHPSMIRRFPERVVYFGQVGVVW